MYVNCGEKRNPPKTLLIQIRPIRNTTGQTADMHKIKIVDRIRPFAAGVVDFESYVGEGIGDLGGGEVGADDFG